jgi:hypothetical protein
MNTNCFAASLKNGYGQSVAPEMIEALGLFEGAERSHDMPVPVRINAGLELIQSIRRAANGNLQRAG